MVAWKAGLELKRLTPNTLHALARRAKERTLNELPRCTRSSTLIVLPNLIENKFL